MRIITKQMAVLVNGEQMNVVEVRADSITDITPPDPSWAVGSLAWDISTGKIYGLTSAGEWVEQTAE
jgi:hypothetical protein